MNLQRIRYKDIERIPQIRIQTNFKQEFAGSSPAPFIGRFGYPRVAIGFLSPQVSGDTSQYDSPRSWSQQNTPIGSIASFRYGLVNSKTNWNVKDLQTSNRVVDICKDIGMASKAVEMEVRLREQPRLQFRPEQEILPFGPQAEVLTARITANPTIDPRVEKVVSDTDLNAAPGLISLYQQGFEENFLTKLLSVGNLGLNQNRKLVPTRWSITAVDDTVGKKLIQEIQDFSVGECQAYFGGAWGNHYLVLFFPEVWSYELFETYLEYQINPWSKKGHFYSTDYENYEGRKNYAEETAGGYYAARLPVLETMKGLKRQQAALVLRFITPEYTIPLGVFVCREAARKSVQSKPVSFSSPESMLQYATELIQSRFGFDISVLLKESKLLRNQAQRKLSSFA